MTTRDYITIVWEYHNTPGHMGGFAYKLMAAWYHADTQNRMKLARGFPWIALAADELYYLGHWKLTLEQFLIHMEEKYDLEEE